MIEIFKKYGSNGKCAIDLSKVVGVTQDGVFKFQLKVYMITDTIPFVIEESFERFLKLWKEARQIE